MSSAVHLCAQAGGLPPLLELMASRNGNLQHNAAFALYGLADNEDNIAAIVRQGGVQCLQDCELLVQVRCHQCCLDHLLYHLCCEVAADSPDAIKLSLNHLLWCYGAMHSPTSAPAGNADKWATAICSLRCNATSEVMRLLINAAVCAAQPSKDCVQKTLKRLEEKIAGKVLNQILYSMNCSDAVMQHRTATALARLAREADLKTVFVERKGLDILLQILTDPKRDALCHKEAAGVLTWPQHACLVRTSLCSTSFLLSHVCFVCQCMCVSIPACKGPAVVLCGLLLC